MTEQRSFLFSQIQRSRRTHPHAGRDFAGALALDEAGYLIAGEDCKTSVPGVFAAGDCRTKQVRQLTTAAADGSIAALGALEYLA